MHLRILGWRYRNLRGGLRDATVDLDPENDRWTLVQMPNGTGKTTTMALLRTALSGEAMDRRDVLDLRAADDVRDGSFEVRLSLDGRTFRVQLRFDFVEGTCRAFTARAEERGGGLEEGLLLPQEFRRLVTPELARLFVFDGELAKEIRAVGKDRAANAIRTLYRLDQLDALNVQVARLVDERQRHAAAVSTATERKGVTRWRRAHEAATKCRNGLVAEQKRLATARKGLDVKAEQLATQVKGRIEQDGALKARKEALDAQREGIDRDVFDLAVQGMSVLRSPAKIHTRVLGRLRALGGRLTELKLPKTISSEFFRELADQPSCVCGQTITPAVREKILERAVNYLAEDQVLVINKMKSALRESSADATEFTTVATALGSGLRELRANKHAHDQLELERLESGDLELERLRGEINEVHHEAERATAALEVLTARDPARQRELGCTDQNNVHLCEAEARRCFEKLATATDTLRFFQQAEAVRRVVADTSALALERLRERVRNATNEKLAQLVPSEALRVARIGGALELASARAASKSGVSEGQSLAVAYAFLTSLLAEAPCKLPFVVDSPAVSLDVQVRREVGELIPGLFRQMIMFVISSERDGFADAFYGREGVRYVTLWRNGDDAAEVRDGLPFFRTFHTAEVAA